MFELFKPYQQLKRIEHTRVCVRCTKHQLIFSLAATCFFGNATRAFLLWDRDLSRAAVQPCGEENKLSHSIYRKPGRINESVITSTSFLLATGLSRAGSIDATWNAAENRLEWEIPPQEARER